MLKRKESKSSPNLCFIFFTFAAADQQLQISVRVGRAVSLTCDGIKNIHDCCESTSWTHNETLTLVDDGEIDDDAGDRIPRLRVTADCSLFVKNVTFEDAGLYTCKGCKMFGRKVLYLSVTDGEHLHHNVFSLTV